MYASAYLLTFRLNRLTVNKRGTDFPEIEEPSQNCKRQKGDIQWAPQISGTTVGNLVAWATWRQESSKSQVTPY
jgi:hypothetical protein